jgi:hypothetical protein
VREACPRLANVLTVDVEEYYHGHEFTRALGVDGVTTLPSRVVGQTERFLDLLDEHGARGTFFTLGVVAQRFSRLVRRIAERGHDVRRTRLVLEQASGRAVNGYRAPNYSIRPDTAWAWTILFEEGYRYDSSVHPIVHDRYGYPDALRFPYVAARFGEAELWEVPVGTARFAGQNLPIGGGFFRLFPTPLLTHAVASVNRAEQRPVVLYVHPWEFDPAQPRPRMAWLPRFRHYTGLDGAEEKLRTLMRGFTFISVIGAFRELTLPRRRESLAS